MKTFAQFLEANDTAAAIQAAMTGMTGGLKGPQGSFANWQRVALLTALGRQGDARSALMQIPEPHRDHLIKFLQDFLPKNPLPPELMNRSTDTVSQSDFYQKNLLPALDAAHQQSGTAVAPAGPEPFSLSGFAKELGLPATKLPDGSVQTQAHTLKLMKNNTIMVMSRTTGKPVYVPVTGDRNKLEQDLARAMV